MKKNYRFIYDYEPTEEQLSEIMREAILEAYEKSKKTELNFKKNLTIEIQKNVEKWNRIIN
ncbi:MAG: hypothetical protein KA885_08205 [Spirochaetes bacterium]|nr:hypothetical protein [Spirochaetota bacterium]